MTCVTRQYRFSASHRLHSPSLSEEANRATYGKCNNPFGHGHDYTLEVCAAGTIDASTGLVIDIARLDRLVDEVLMPDFRNRNLNDLAAFERLVPTTENLAIVAERNLAAHWRRWFPAPGPELRGVRILETGRNGFETGGMRP
jgi:6-pyruvoyltetrahydropterin/6-carboxytetrahydropterin synthase